MANDTYTFVDIGNTFAKIYKNGVIKKVESSKFDLKEKFYYICVKSSIIERLKQNPFAHSIENFIKIESNYCGLGIDRKVLCNYIDDGVIVDAGSAITVDIMQDKIHQGGFILPGLSFLYKTYEKISPILKVKRINEIDLYKFPQNTKEAVNYGLVAPIVAILKEISKDKKIYFTGGDGFVLSKYFEDSIYDEMMIFEAMKKIIKENLC